MTARIFRGQIYSFDSSTWTANVLLEGSQGEVVIPVGEWIPSNMLAAQDSVAVLVFDDTNPDDAVVLGPYGAVQAALTLVGLNLGSATGASAGQIIAEGTLDSFEGRRRHDTNTAGATLLLKRSRDNSGANEVVQDGDYLGRVVMYGYDGDQYIQGADIHAEVGGSPGNNDMPTDLVFAVTADGATTPTERLRLTADGRVYGTAIHDAGTTRDYTGTDNQYVASGTYTPTFTGVTNITATTAGGFQWIRVGRVVTVSGALQVDPTTGGLASEVGISLPIASDFTVIEHCSGVAACGDLAGEVAEIRADAANDRAAMIWVAGDGTNRVWHVHFTYVVR